jgi:indole-3-glycerol phosphate synthase
VSTTRSGYLACVRRRLEAEPPPAPRGFARALREAPGVGLIAEIKRGSPSEGAIAPAADVAATARRYAEGGAAALSVLCAERDFGGRLEDLAAARAAAALPALAKDFVLHPQQVAAQRLAGADAVLVILAMVDDAEARALLDTAALLGMDALVETHDEREIERALALEAAIVGVNARDLETLEVDAERQLELLGLVPPAVLRVAESGIAARADVERVRDAGADAVLVGSALMRRPELIGELAGVPR